MTKELDLIAQIIIEKSSELNFEKKHSENIDESLVKVLQDELNILQTIKIICTEHALMEALTKNKHCKNKLWYWKDKAKKLRIEVEKFKKFI